MAASTGLIWWPNPIAGDIVYCLYPQPPQNTPGPKPRPTFITQVFDDLSGKGQFQVEVAYGTSQNTTSLISGEFVIGPSDKKAFPISGLRSATKFHLKKIVKLPYNSDWFKEPNPVKFVGSPKLGSTDPSIQHKVIAAVKAVM